MIILFTLTRDSSCTCRGKGLCVLIANLWSVKPGMSANEEEVHILSVIQAGFSNERNIKS